MTTFLRILATLIVLIGAFGAFFMVGMRAKWAPVQNAVKRVNKAVFNPMQMKKAGQPGAYAAIIRHTGRTSGKAYETPISPLATDDGFVVTLPYGTSPDWLKNIRAAGTAELVYDSKIYTVDEPRIGTLGDASPWLGEGDIKTAQRMNIDDFLFLRTVAVAD